MKDINKSIIGALEKEIIKLVDNKIINLEKVEVLFKNGANPNALEYINPDKGFNDDTYWDTLFSECIFEAQDKKPNLYPLLEMFIKYGLDVNKYGPSIIGDFHFVMGKSNIFEMTKLILDKMDKNIDISQALSNIGTEESYLNCCFDDMDYESNDLFGLYELIVAFANNKPYKSFYRLPRKLNEKFMKLDIGGVFVTLEKNKVTVKSDKHKMCMISKIQMEKNTLIVEDNYGVYINNEDQNEYKDNVFTEYANKHFKNEKIIDLTFKHYQIELSPTSHAQGRVVTINFTNHKKLVYDEDSNNNLETIEII